MAHKEGAGMRDLFKDKKKTALIAVLCAAMVIAVIAVILVRKNGAKGDGEVDTTAVARGQEEEGDLHYFDEEAVALAGEADVTATANEALATLNFVNAERAKVGLGPLVWSNDLAAAAMVRAIECVDRFSHTRPNNMDWWTVNSAIMYGENLAKNYFNANSVVAAWMASPTHRANVVGAFNSVGAAAYQAPDGTWYWAQEFGY